MAQELDAVQTAAGKLADSVGALKPALDAVVSLVEGFKPGMSDAEKAEATAIAGNLGTASNQLGADLGELQTALASQASATPEPAPTEQPAPTDQPAPTEEPAPADGSAASASDGSAPAADTSAPAADAGAGAGDLTGLSAGADSGASAGGDVAAPDAGEAPTA